MGQETIIVLGGAKSAEDHDIQNLRSQGYVIGINDAAIHAPVDCALTMDRTWFESRHLRIKALGIPLYARREAVINVKERWTDLRLFMNDRNSNAMSLEKDRLNGINSGFCGLNLAFQMQPARVKAVGITGIKEGYWYAPYEWQTADKPRGLTSDWAYGRWAAGLEDIRQQFIDAGIEWI